MRWSAKQSPRKRSSQRNVRQTGLHALPSNYTLTDHRPVSMQQPVLLIRLLPCGLRIELVGFCAGFPQAHALRLGLLLLDARLLLLLGQAGLLARGLAQLLRLLTPRLSPHAVRLALRGQLNTKQPLLLRCQLRARAISAVTAPSIAITLFAIAVLTTAVAFCRSWGLQLNNCVPSNRHAVRVDTMVLFYVFRQQQQQLGEVVFNPRENGL
mmetsp:Transcript_57747/g.125373  ORF Transcript_57747/g.125373 Transcript_57747/m.125373 type:complete len:211 (-) Transcript_57747:547-1179(-)